MVSLDDFDTEIDVIALSFATRQLLNDLDRDLMIPRALESLSDFGRSDRVGLWLLDDPRQTVTAEGGIVSTEGMKQSFQKAISGTPFEDVISKRTPNAYPLIYEHELPFPIHQNGIPGRQCLVAPLIAADNQVIGMVTFDHPADFSMSTGMMQPLMVLLTVVAIGLETARLFRLAVIDGLTGLYVRRYFELRLAEEENRIKRYGGRMALMITDIDHFKKFNDTYGHQQGDIVLRETAQLLQKSVRIGLDVVCRYGGEEFVVIMPNTDEAGAMVVAERVRKHCQDNEFSGQAEPLHVTLSGGVAFMDQDSWVPGQELLRRADESLYRAKEGGRNRIQFWDD
ncbi:MAG: sensor domain-containing diguanylate cyclase [Pseudomonadota bacterium]